MDHVDDFNQDGNVDTKRSDIYAWPGKNNPYFEEFNGFPIQQGDYPLAEFIDVDQDGNYNPDHGDYPTVHNLSADRMPNRMILLCIIIVENMFFNQNML